MTEQTTWLSIDTISKAAVPISTLLLSVAVYLGTREANSADRESKAKERCQDGTINLLNDAEQLITLAEGAPASGTQDSGQGRFNDRLVARAQKVNVAAQFVERDCKAAEVAIPIDVQRGLCTLRELVPDADVQAGLMHTANAIGQPSVEQPIISSLRPRSAALCSNGGSPTRPIMS